MSEREPILKGPIATRIRERIKAIRERIKLGAEELPPRGTGLITGTARKGTERGRGRPLSDEERRERHRRTYGEGIHY